MPDRNFSFANDQLDLIKYYFCDRYVVAYKKYLLDNNLPSSTVNRRLSTLRTLADFCLKQGLITSDPTVSITNLETVKKPVIEPQQNEILDKFNSYLEAQNNSANTIKNYLSDIREYLIYAKDKINDKNTVKDFMQFLAVRGTSQASLKRLESSLKKFYSWAVEEKIVSINPFRFKLQSSIFKLPLKSYRALPYFTYLNFLILIIFLTALGFGVYRHQFIVQTPEKLAFPNAPVTHKRFLSFQGLLTKSDETPITSATDVTFKLYDDAGIDTPPTGGNLLWNSGTCSIDPDTNGIFDTILGSTCGSEIPSSVFTGNNQVWLEITVISDTLSPRIQIATAAYALNSKTLQGFPLAGAANTDPTAAMGATARTIPAINPAGNLVIASASPTLWSTSGTFAIKGQALSIVTATGTNGNITLAPDGSGVLNLTLSAGTGNVINATDANLGTTGGKEANTLLYGSVSNSTNNYNLLKLESGSSPTAKFTVDYAGNASAAGILRALTTGSYFTGDVTVSGGDITGANGVGLDIGEASTDYVTSSVGYAVGGASTYYINSSGTGNLNALTLAGNLTLNANVASSLIPSSTSAYDLGSSSKYWNNLYANNIYAPSSGTSGYWQRNSGALSPTNITDDLLLGATATSSALVKLTGTSGGNSWINTGNVGIGTTAPTKKLDVNGDINIASGMDYYINGTSVLNATTLGSTVVNSSLDSVDALNSGSITSGFGSIDTGADNIITTGTMGSAGNTAFTGLSLTLSGQLSSSYANSAAINLTGNGSGITFTGTGPNQIITASGVNLGLMPGGNVGIGTTAPADKLAVSGGALIGSSYASLLSAPVNGLLVEGNVGIGTTSPSTKLDINGNLNVSGYATASASVGIGTTAAAGPGNLNILGNLTVSGSTVLGTSTTNSLTVNGYVTSDLVPNPGSAYNLGSNTRRWLNVWADTITASNISGTVVTGSTSANDWLINSDNATADTEDDTLTFERGTPATNAEMRWNSDQNNIDGVPAKTISVNAPFVIAPDSGMALSGSAALIVNQLQTDQNIFVASASGTPKFVITNSGNVGIGTTAPGTKLDVRGGLNAGTNGTEFTVSATGLVTGGTYNLQTLSSAANFTGSVAIAGAVTGATSYNGLVITANTGAVTTGSWHGTVIDADHGGTGQTVYAVGDLLYASTTTALSRLADVAAGNALISGGVGIAPSWGKVVLGTHTSGNYVSTLTGTANQITVSAATGDVTLSIPSDFRAPGTVNAVSGLYTGATAGTLRLDSAGALSNITSLTLSGAISGGTTYSGSGNITSTAGVLTISGTGNSSFVGNVGIGTTGPLDKLDVNGGVRSTDLRFLGTGYVTYGLNSGVESLIFRYGGAEKVRIDSSGNVGIGTTGPGAKLEVAGQVKITGGTPGTNKVLTSDTVGLASWTDLGGIGVTSVTGTPNQITASPTTGAVVLSIPSDFRAPGTVNAVSGLYTGAVAGTQRVDASGNLVNIGTITASGAVTAGTYNGQTISSAANFTGSLTMAGTFTRDTMRYITESRNLTQTAGDWVNVGSFANNGVGIFGKITVYTHTSGTIQMATYSFAHDAYSSGSSATWIELPPDGQNSLYGDTQTVAVDVYNADRTLTSSPVQVRLRTKAGFGATAGVTVLIETNAAFTASTTSGIGATVASGYLGSKQWMFPASTGPWNATTDGLYILSNGNVGIGTTDPGAYKLNVNGNINITGSVAIAGAVTGATGYNGMVITANTGVVTTGTWNATVIGATYGGTGQNAVTTGDLLYGSAANTWSRLADVAAGNVLISGGINIAPSWGKVVLGTHTSGNYVSTLTGTANQITVSAATGDITLSIPSDFRAPGTVNAVSGLYTGATAGTQRVDASGNLVNIGTITASGAVTAGTYNGQTISSAANFTGTLTAATSLSAPILISTVAGGTAPLTVTSTTLVTNLNADLLDGQHGAYYAPLANISGTTNYVAKFTGANSVGNSLIYDNGTNVGIGTTGPGAKLDVIGKVRSTGFNNAATAQTVKGLTWSRIVDLVPENLFSTSFIVNISGTRGNVVWNSTWQVTTGHSTYGYLTLLSSTNYTQSRLRLVVDGNGDGYLEFYDQGTGAVLGTDQTIYIAVNNILGSSAILTSFQDGTTTTGYTVMPEATSIAGGLISQGGALITGNVGIGTTGPGAKLHVKSSAQIAQFETTTARGSGGNYLQFNDPTGIKGYVGYTGSDDTLATWNALGDLQFGASGAEAMRIKSGNVGIGTTGPGEKLEVKGNILANGGGLNNKLMVNRPTTTDYARVDFTTAAATKWTLGLRGDHTANYFSLYDEVAGATRLVVDTTGNVGIGTVGPGATLDVSGTSRVTSQLFVGSTIAGSGYVQIAGASGGTKQLLGVGISAVSNGFTVATDASNNLTFGLTLGTSLFPGSGIWNTSGNVGIGTTSPGKILHIKGADPKIAITYTSGTSGIEFIRDTTAGGSKIQNLRDEVIGGLGLNFLTTADNTAEVNATYTSRMAILNSGNVGIGTTGPGYKLDVSGDFRTTGYMGQTGSNANLWFNETTTFIGRAGGTNYHIDGSLLGDLAVRSTSGQKLLLGTGTTLGLAINAGNVGIGTTGPLSKLSINGGLHVGGDSDAGDNNILADGTITATTQFTGPGTGLTGTAASLTSANTKFASYTANAGWNRILYMAQTNLGSNVLLAVTSTRGSYVSTSTFMISTSHNSFGIITQLSSLQYSQLNIRVLAHQYGDMIVDIDFGSAVADTTIGITAIPLSNSAGALTLYSSATDGSSIPVGYASADSFTTISRGVRAENITATGTGLFAGDVSAPIFRDRDSPTTYYVDPSGTSVLNSISGHTVTGTLNMGNQAITGVYSIQQYTSSNWSLDNAGNINISGQYKKGGAALNIECGSYTSAATTGDAICANNYAGSKCTVASGSGYIDSACTNASDTQARCCRLANGFDLAELFPASEPLEPGELVAVDPNKDESLIRTSRTEQKDVLGVISSAPGITLDGTLPEGTKFSSPLALAGRVPVKVVGVNGSIKRGDFLTTSPIPGRAMRAVGNVRTIGVALSEFNNNENLGAEGTVTVFVNLSWNNDSLPEVQIKAQEIVVNTIKATNGNWLIDEFGIATLNKVVISTKTVVNAFDNQTTLIAEKVLEIKDSLGKTIASIGEDGTIFGRKLVAEQKIVSPIVETEEIRFKNKNGETVMKIAENGQTIHFGDLLVKGQVTSDNLQVNGDATVSGTLYADNIVTKNGTFGDLLANQIAASTVSAQYITYVNNIYQPTPTPELTGSVPVTPAISASDGLTSPISSESALLLSQAPTWPLTDPSGNIKITSDIQILGRTSLADTSIAGQLMVDATVLINSSGISSLPASTLYLQPSGWGAIDIMAGKILVDLEGNIRTLGKIMAKEFAPLPESDLVFNLERPLPATDTAHLYQPSSSFGKLLVKGLNNETVASIDETGSARFAGSISADSLQISADYTATQSAVIAEINTNATSGIGLMPAGYTEFTIYNSKITNDTLIYVTPEGSTQNKVLYISAKQAEDPLLNQKGFFKVAIDTAIDTAIKFNWWIIN